MAGLINNHFIIRSRSWLCVVLLLVSSGYAQLASAQTDISDVSKLQAVNRRVSVSAGPDGQPVVHLDTAANVGLAWIKGLTFKSGTISFRVRGKNIPQESFVGIAFHGLDDRTYDAVYFRPFNFQSPDESKRAHSVQYIDMPDHDWFLLREKFPGRYENQLVSVPDPDGWFHVRITIAESRVSVFVNEDKQPSLVVQKLNTRSDGRIGFWVGNSSEGDFSDLTVNPQ
ncbi:MAG: hypothetical protein INR69_00215 [Mucilaginibacter polytrichastri]|nr:hypothetical protein [Mucilaginibacter polytrichastri]